MEVGGTSTAAVALAGGGGAFWSISVQCIVRTPFSDSESGAQYGDNRLVHTL